MMNTELILTMVHIQFPQSKKYIDIKFDDTSVLGEMQRLEILQCTKEK